MSEDLNREEVRAYTVKRENGITSAGITLAVVTLDQERVGIAWLPELFKRPLDPAIRALIAEQLRFHAEKLESGQLEQRMRAFSTINDERKD
jgi:hypothetical protein